MADKKITQLTAETVVEGTDLFPIVVDVSGTPTTKKVSASVLVDYLNGALTLGASTLDALDDVTIVSASNGQLLSYNGSAWVNSAPVAAYNPVEGAVFS